MRLRLLVLASAFGAFVAASPAAAYDHHGRGGVTISFGYGGYYPSYGYPGYGYGSYGYYPPIYYGPTYYRPRYYSPYHYGYRHAYPGYYGTRDWDRRHHRRHHRHHRYHDD